MAWMHTFSPAKMWISGLDALQKPLLHLHTQAGHGAAVVDHRHGLHEPQPGRARGPRVRPHPVPPAASRARPWRVTWSHRSCLADRGLGAGRGRAGPTCGTLRLARFGDNMRDVAVTEGDKVEAAAAVRCLGQHLRRQRPRRRRGPGGRRRHRHAGHRVCRHLPGLAGAAAGRRPARLPALRRPHRAGPSRVPGRGRLRGLHHELRGPRRTASAARPRRPAADGRRRRLRRRGRLEDLGAAARREGDGARAAGRHVLHGGLHLSPGAGRGEGPRRAHARGLPVDHARRSPPSRSTRSASVAARTRCGCGSPPIPAQGVVASLSDVGDRFRLTVNEIDLVEPDEELPQPSGRVRGLEAAALTVHVRRGLADGRVPRTTPCSPRRSGSRSSRTSPR